MAPDQRRQVAGVTFGACGAGKRKSDVGAGYDEERLLVLSDQAAATAEKVFEELISIAALRIKMTRQIPKRELNLL